MKPEKGRILRELTQDELKHKLKSYRQELFKLRFEVKSGQVEKPDRIKTIRKNIARILTILKEKQHVQQSKK
jgi:large subunit ribosomal protein L29